MSTFEFNKEEQELLNIRLNLKEKEKDLTNKKILLRLETLKELYNELIKNYDEDFQSAVELNVSLLYSVVKSYYDDINRFKTYSCSKLADKHKQGAYTIKWIIKFHPIQFKEQNLNSELFLINSTFALFVGFSFLDKKVFNSISEEFYYHLIYNTLYRHFSGRQWALLLYVIETAANNKKTL